MEKIVQIEAKNEAEAKKIAAEKFSVSIDKVEIIKLEKKGFLGFGKKIIADIKLVEDETSKTEFVEDNKQTTVNQSEVSSETVATEVQSKLDVNEAIKAYIEQYLNSMNIEATVTVEKAENDERLTFRINSDNNGVLIGKNGATIEALNTMAKQYSIILAEQNKEKKVLFNVRVADYKSTRDVQLEILAVKSAKKVVRYGMPVKLQPMNSYERRIVHARLAGFRGVKTLSEGEKPNRFVVIKPN